MWGRPMLTFYRENNIKVKFWTIYANSNSCSYNKRKMREILSKRIHKEFQNLLSKEGTT